jgi:hypothetical protein
MRGPEASLGSVWPSSVDAIDGAAVLSRIKAIKRQQRSRVSERHRQSLVVVNPQIVAEPHDCQEAQTKSRPCPVNTTTK